MNTNHYPTPSTTCPTCGLPGRDGHACTGAELVPGDDERHAREMPASIERLHDACSRAPRWVGGYDGHTVPGLRGPCVNGAKCPSCAGFSDAEMNEGV